MKRIALKRLTLQNFKGAKEQTTTFSPTQTTLAGENGIGKTRHFDAFLWLIFGKDAQGRDNYEVKTRLADGSQLHKVDCWVEGVLDVDGEELTLRRAIHENWVKPRGQAEHVYKGDTTECYWNEAPIQVGDYRQRVAELIDMDIFKMITNPAFFASMDWKLRREQLFALAGTITDDEIASQKPEYRALLDAISGKSIADFKRERAAKKKCLKEQLAQIQPRIAQTQSLMPEAEDFPALKSEMATLDAKIKTIDKQLADADLRRQTVEQERNAIQATINDLKRQAEDVLFKANEGVRQAEREREAAQLNDKREVAGLQEAISQQQDTIDRIGRDILRLEAQKAKYKDEQDALRKQWYAINAEMYTRKQYHGETTCPHCHQPLPADMVANARALWERKEEQAEQSFNEDKERRLNENQGRGMDYSNIIKETQGQVDNLRRRLDDAQFDLESLVRKLKAKKESLAAKPQQEPLQQVRAEEIPDWCVLQSKIKANQALLDEAPAANEREAMETLVYQRSQLTADRSSLNARLAKRETIAKYKEVIADLEKQGREYAQAIANLERDELTLQEFTKAKVTECESRVASKFHLVTFRLFRFTLEGNPEETCEVMVNGVPYPSANTASQINAGLDIINALCTFYGVSAPIFIDRRESVLDLLHTDSQIINLKVSDDKTLQIIHQ